MGKIAYLHNELDGSDEETKELENEILLLLLHLVETILLASLEDLLGSKTEAGISGDCDEMVSQLHSTRRVNGRYSRMSSGTTRPAPGPAVSSSSSSCRRLSANGAMGNRGNQLGLTNS